jgi:hypothetical protein
MARKKKNQDMPTAIEEKPAQARLELPPADMERLRRAGKSIGLSLSAFIRQAVLEKAVEVEKRMGTK